MSTVVNYTPIDDLIKKIKNESESRPKEAEPVPYREKGIEIHELVEHKVEHEVKPYISPRAETIELPPDVQAIGAQISTQPKFSTYNSVKLPISDDKVIQGLHAPLTSSIRWLATVAIYMLKRAHLGLRMVHGKVTRVLEK